MRKILAPAALALTVLTTACGSSRAAGGGGGGTGAATPVSAVERFLGAARARDTRSMAEVWGTAEGPMSGRVSGEETEKRMAVLQCFLSHDDARVTADQSVMGGGRQVTVELRQRELVRPTRFNAVSGPGSRWYVESFDIEAVRDFCRAAPPSR